MVFWANGATIGANETAMMITANASGDIYKSQILRDVEVTPGAKYKLAFDIRGFGCQTP